MMDTTTTETSRSHQSLIYENSLALMIIMVWVPLTAMLNLAQLSQVFYYLNLSTVTYRREWPIPTETSYLILAGAPC